MHDYACCIQGVGILHVHMACACNLIPACYKHVVGECMHIYYVLYVLVVLYVHCIEYGETTCTGA